MLIQVKLDTTYILRVQGFGVPCMWRVPQGECSKSASQSGGPERLPCQTRVSPNRKPVAASSGGERNAAKPAGDVNPEPRHSNNIGRQHSSMNASKL